MPNRLHVSLLGVSPYTPPLAVVVTIARALPVRRLPLGARDLDRGRQLYLDGHIPGASFLDVDADLSDLSVKGQGRHPLPSRSGFAEVAGRAGIARASTLWPTGAGRWERLWWLLRHFGHNDCAVLAHGIEDWVGPLVGGEERIEPATFVARERSGDTIDGPELAERLGEVIVVDTRLESRWRGEENPIDKVPGRIPGALNAPWNEPVPELPAGDLVAYCGSGVTSTVLIHLLALAGREGKLYPGSWSQWETLDLPVERG